MLGDTPIHVSGYDLAAVAEREHEAAHRIFGLLPSPQGQEILALWQEFEAGQSADARFAKALDRLQPLLLNTLTEGGTWKENGVSEEQVVSRYGPTIAAGSPALWQHARQLVSRHFVAQERASSERPPDL